MNFKRYPVLLKSAIAVVIFLFGAFSGFLLDIAPPGGSGSMKFQLGIAQFVSLAILLFISLLSNFQATRNPEGQRKFIRLWLVIGGILIMAFSVAAVRYYHLFNSYTVYQRDWDIRFVKGDLTRDSRDICREENQFRSVSECESFLLYKYYNSSEVNDKHFLWTEQSVNDHFAALLTGYLMLIASLSGTIFSLIELLTWNMFQKNKES